MSDPLGPAGQDGGTDPRLGLTVVHRRYVPFSHAHYAGDLVDGAYSLGCFGDVATEVCIRTDGDEGLFAGYSDVRFLAPVRAGDVLDAAVDRREGVGQSMEAGGQPITRPPGDQHPRQLARAHDAGVLGHERRGIDRHRVAEGLLDHRSPDGTGAHGLAAAAGPASDKPTPEQRQRMLDSAQGDPEQLERRKRFLEALDRGDPQAVERWKMMQQRRREEGAAQ